MTEPVKLSRERWDSLRRDFREMELHSTVQQIVIATPTEIDGITFLPATYVPDSATASAPYSMRTFASELDWRA